MRILLTICSFIIFLNVNGQYTLSGYVTDAESGEELIGVTLLDLKTKKGAVTNAYGFYSLTLPNDTLLLRVSYIGYTTQLDTVVLTGPTRVNYALNIKTSTLEDIVVYAEAFVVEEEVKSTEMGVFVLKPKEAFSLPSIGGEADILKVAQLMPGIQKGGEATTALYVRGGTDDQNLVTLDEATVYNVGHLLGFFSVFNADAMRDVKVIKGGFPAEYGGRLSAVMDMRMQEGNFEKIQAKGGIGLLTSRITVDGPIVKDKASFMVAARRTYIDRVFGLFGVPFPYYFYDYNAKMNVKLSNRDRLYFSSYFGNDVLGFDDEDAQSPNENFGFGFNLGNFTTSLRWNHIHPDDKLFRNITLIQTRFKYDIGGNFVNNSLLIKSQIQDIGLKADWDYYPSPDRRIEFGAHSTLHYFRPNILNTGGEVSDFLKSKKGNIINTQEIALYGGVEETISDRLKIYYGLRLSGAFTANRFYGGVEPRLTGNYSLTDLTSVKASYAVMRQYMHRVSSSSILLPTDLWYPVTDNVEAQTSHQFSLGIFRGIPEWNTNVSVEGYYKTMSNLIEYREGAQLLFNDNFEQELVSGKGDAYGLEFLIRKKSGPLYGWVGYTLAFANRDFKQMNGGKPFPAKYDRRHDISFVGIAKLTKKTEISWVWVYTSGASFTPQTGQYLMPNATLTDVSLIPIYTDRNEIKLSSSHRLDLNFIVKTKPRKRFQGEWQFSVYNFYNRAAPSRVIITGNGRNLEYSQPGVFGFIPAVSYNFEF